MKRVTMTDVSRRAGVSKNTVSLALRNDPQIPESTRQRVRQAAADLGYTANPVVSELMAELRRGSEAGYKHNFALINANHDRQAFLRHPTIPDYVAGCRQRAAQLGYGLDEFWLHDPNLGAGRLESILRARGIRGALVIGMMKENRLPPDFETLWRGFAAVVTGVRTHDPTLSFACVDHHALVVEALERIREVGIRRPALVIEGGIDRLVGGRFTAAFEYAVKTLPRANRLEPFLEVDSSRERPKVFREWLIERKPDAILTLHTVVEEWVNKAGLRVPQDIGLVQLECRRGCEDWAGMEQHNDLTGEAAVDLLVSLTTAGKEPLSLSPRGILITPTWRDGRTLSEPAGWSGAIR
jgi:DNA-binding LacI/PurR family transcriptional regulator